MTSKVNIYELAGGELSLWAIPGSSIMMKFNPKDDPLELGEGEVAELIDVLNKLLKQIS